MAGNQILTELLLNISTNTASLQKGLSEAKGKLDGFSQGINKMKSLLVGAFAVTSIIAAGKSIFEFGENLDSIVSKLDDLGVSMNLAADAGKVQAIASAFDVDLNRVIEAAKASSQQFGTSFSDALTKVQQGLSLAGPQSEKYLKSLESQAAGYAELGGSADQFFTIVTDGYRTSSNFEKTLQTGAKSTIKSFSDLTGQMNEGQLVQQRMLEASSAFNAEIANLFDGTGDALDGLKATAYEIGLKAFQTVKKAIVDTINYFIDLYNNSILFRATVQSIILYFKQMWEIIKLIGNLIADVFSVASKYIKALFTGDFKAIPGILADGFKSAVDDFKTFGADSMDNFLDAAKATLSKQKIQFIDENDVQQQATKAVNIIARTIGGAGKKSVVNNSIGAIIAPKKVDGLPDKVGTPEGMDKHIEAVNRLSESYVTLGETIHENIGGVATGAFESLGQMIVGTNDKSKQSFGQFVVSILSGIAKIIQGYFATAIAAAIASESKKGLIGLITGAIAVGAVTALFKKSVPKYEHGGLNTSNSMAMVGEAGAELVSLPSGSRVYNNRDTNNMMSSFNGSQTFTIKLESMTRGSDLYSSQKEYTRRLNKRV